MAKRMTLEEKRQAMLDLFENSRSFYKIQELEKIGSREKGIVEKTIKDVVNSLLDDDLISGDKIGTSIYYWGNHSKKRHGKMIECMKVIEEIERLEASISKSREEMKREECMKPMSKEKQELLEIYKELNQRLEEQSESLQGYTTLDEEEIKAIKIENERLVQEINVLTDNIFVLQNFVCDKFGLEKKEFNASFGVSPEMDYVE